jgi:ubiquinone/menaquinone biosynthesis C-methylase UbiE
MPTDKQTIEWYNQHADDYTEHVRDPDDSIYHGLYEKPAMYKLLPNLDNKSVVSLGCGSGEDCHYLRQQGANSVIGVDISDGMIGVAKASYSDCQFEVMDMEHLTFDDASFDFAYSSLAIHYLEDWSKALSEAFRVLKPDSYFLFSCNHPVYTALETVENTKNSKTQVLSRIMDRDTNKVTIVGDYVARHDIHENGWVTWHKSIGEISAEITRAGFMIAGIVEPQPLDKMNNLSPKDYQVLRKIPNFLIFKLWKP